jgi:hypothetical protein
MKLMLMKGRYRARYHWSLAEGRIRWALDPSYDNDLAVLEGSWDLFGLEPGRTLGRFGTKIDVGAALPAFVQDYATRKRVPEAMENTRKWIDSGGSYRP